LYDIKKEITKETHFFLSRWLVRKLLQQKLIEQIYPRHIVNKQRQIRMDKSDGKRNKWDEVAVKKKHINYRGTEQKLLDFWSHDHDHLHTSEFYAKGVYFDDHDAIIRASQISDIKVVIKSSKK
jgi:hypothetical protein